MDDYEYEAYLKSLLAELNAWYRDRAAPIIAALVDIESRKPPVPVAISTVDLDPRVVAAFVRLNLQ